MATYTTRFLLAFGGAAPSETIADLLGSRWRYSDAYGSTVVLTSQPMALYWRLYSRQRCLAAIGTAHYCSLTAHNFMSGRRARAPASARGADHLARGVQEQRQHESDECQCRHPNHHLRTPRLSESMRGRRVQSVAWRAAG